MKKICWLGFWLSFLATVILLISFAKIVVIAVNDSTFPTCVWFEGSCDQNVVTIGNVCLAGAFVFGIVAVIFLTMAMHHE